MYRIKITAKNDGLEINNALCKTLEEAKFESLKKRGQYELYREYIKERAINEEEISDDNMAKAYNLGLYTNKLPYKGEEIFYCKEEKKFSKTSKKGYEKFYPYKSIQKEISEILEENQTISFHYYRVYQLRSRKTTAKLCPVCGAEIREQSNEHFFRNASNIYFSDKLYNLHICCSYCNTDNKDIKFHPYFHKPTLKLTNIDFIKEEEAIEIRYLNIEDLRGEFTLELQNRQLDISVKKLYNITLKDDNARRKGIIRGFCCSIEELETDILTELMYIYTGSTGRIKKVDEKIKEVLEKSFNNDKSYWKYAVIMEFRKWLISDVI